MPETVSRSVPVAPGVALNVRHRPGSGTPFLLVHGLASNARMWDGVAAALDPHPSYAVDLRGHGRSSKPDGGYDIASVAADLAGLVERLQLPPAVVAGQSWGAPVVLQLAATTKVRAVVAVDGALTPLRRRWPDFASCWADLAPPTLAGRPVADLAGMFRRAHPDWPPSGLEGALACFEVRPDGTASPWLSRERHRMVLRGLWDFEADDVLPRVGAPTLLIPARNATSLSREADVSATVALLPHGRVHWLDGDHDLHAQHPQQVADLLLDLLETTP